MHLEMSADTTSTRVGFCMLELVALALSLDIAGASNTNLRVAHTSVLRNGVVLVSHVASPGYIILRKQG